MRRLLLISFLFIVNVNIYAQKKVARYYVGGLLYCRQTYFINNERSETSFLNVNNTQNYKGSNYSSCASCRYHNNYGVDVMNFQDKNFNNAFTMCIRYIDKQNCILIFQTPNNDADKMEVYLAKEIITDN